MRRMKSLAWLAAVAFATCCASRASADNAFPQRAVRIVAAQQAGSATDHLARAVADALADDWQRPVVVDNRPGAGGAIGTSAAARATPDGHTLLVGGLSNMVTSPLLLPDFGVRPERDFVAIGRIAFVPFILAVHTGMPGTTFADFVAHARRHPGEVAYGTVGLASFSRLVVDLLARDLGLAFLPVEYKGAPAATLDVAAGRIQFQVSEVGAVKQQADAGTLRLLAVAGNRRASRAPGVPTLGEASGVEIPLTPWYGLFAPAGTPPAILERLAEAYRRAMGDPRTVARIEALGYETVIDGPGAFAAAIAQDLSAVRDMARRTGYATY